MRITVTSVLVDDQRKALRFYTEVLGFTKKTEVPMGEHRLAHRRVTGGPRRRGAWCWSRTSTRGAAVQGGARRRRRPVHVLRGARRARRVRAAARSGRAVHPGARRHGRLHHGGARRHLRQPADDRQPLSGCVPATGRRPARRGAARGR
nr:VOC family protein [Angustibacter aerolatus]